MIHRNPTPEIIPSQTQIRAHDRGLTAMSVVAMATFGLGLFGLFGCTGGTGDGNTPVDRSEYPEAPYGTAEGDVIEPHVFTDVDGTESGLEAIFKIESNTLLLLSTAAGWCAPCREEQPALQARKDEWGDKGLAVMVAIFEDSNYQPATATFADAWKTQYELDVEVVVDESFELSAYYNEDLTPMNMFVDVDTMEIVRVQTGFDESSVDAIIESRLAD